MDFRQIIKHEILQVRDGDFKVLLHKMQRIVMLPFYVTILIIIRLLRPWFLVRFGGLVISRIGHFVANTELYLCELEAGINKPKQAYLDLFFFPDEKLCNYQLAAMWRRVLHVWPSWILAPISLLNQIIPGGAAHDIGNNTQYDRDVHNLLDRFPAHLKFSADELAYGEACLRKMGIPYDAQIVCLFVRDNAYLDHHQPGDWSSHDYRDCDIQSYVLAAEELANRGYFVIRMGSKVKEAFSTAHPQIIDYASNGMRSDFMDIYLGFKCRLCISTGSGWDCVPAWGFRRHLVSVNSLPIGYLPSFSNKFILTAKRHFLSKEKRDLTLSEIFDHQIGFCLETAEYVAKDVEVIQNTPEEIRDVVVEMVERLDGSWQPHEDDEALQKQFWHIFPTNAVDPFQGRPLHGEIRARYGTRFLRNNRHWLK